MIFFAVLLSMLIGEFSIGYAPPFTLKEVFKDDFLIGTAVNEGQFYENDLHMPI